MLILFLRLAVSEPPSLGVLFGLAHISALVCMPHMYPREMHQQAHQQAPGQVRGARGPFKVPESYDGECGWDRFKGRTASSASALEAYTNIYVQRLVFVQG